MATYLDGIMAAHREAAEADQRSFDDLFADALQSPIPRSLAHALSAEGLSVIAEFKRRSPSKGVLNQSMDLGAMLEMYQEGGASAISVLTDLEFFGGSLTDLSQARQITSLPLLRKDFVVDERDLCDARISGADAVLLIVAALEDGELRHLSHVAVALDLDVLVEVHDEPELERAIDLSSSIVGVNQRDLRTFEVDLDRALGLLDSIPSEVIAVAESGIGSREEAARLAEAGFDAVLVGETFVRSADPRATVAAMAGCNVGRREETARS
jgi:indole-3-glycerol phosphate synthase